MPALQRMSVKYIHARLRVLFPLILAFLLIQACNDQRQESRPLAETPALDTHREAFTSAQAEPFVRLALDCAVQEYPNKIGHTMLSDADQGTPGSLHPVFYGCFDWHSSVHGHWLLARFARLYPEHPLSEQARDVLKAHLTTEKVSTEVDYLMAEGRASWERPYGLAWLLQLAAELKEWQDEGDSEAGIWSETLQPLEEACVQRLETWLPKLAYPIRTGEHSQTAFAFGMMLDYARIRENQALEALVVETSMRLYSQDIEGDLRFEPSGQDFLSPLIAEADLMRRVMEPREFAGWLTDFLPGLSGDSGWLPVATVTDRSDGKLAHLDGLNLSRAWMLEGIAQGLPRQDKRLKALFQAASEHKEAGLSAVTGEHYEGGHWLGTYAMYLSSGRGL